MLFHEIYSTYFQTVAKILTEAVEHPLTTGEINAIIQNHAFEESTLNIPESLGMKHWQLLKEDGTTILGKKPTMPLTILQKRWINAIALDPRMRLFTDQPVVFSDVEPLFLIYIRRLEDYLRLNTIRDVIELPIDDALDINGWDLQKTLRLLHKSNPTLFEWFSSPIVYQETEFADKFRDLMMHYFSSKKTKYHYVSMAEENYREYLTGDLIRAKKYFYVLRPVLACQWILDRGTPPPILFSELLKAELPVELIDVVNQLLELKMNSPEVKLIKRISEINEYLDESIPRIKRAVRLLEDSLTPDWNELNQLFLHSLEWKGVYNNDKL